MQYKKVKEQFSGINRIWVELAMATKQSTDQKIRYKEQKLLNVEKKRVFKQHCVDYKGGKCAICGYKKCFAALDFHHLVPKKKKTGRMGIGQISNFQFNARITEELDACILICANCHRELHFKKKGGISL